MFEMWHCMKQTYTMRCRQANYAERFEIWPWRRMQNIKWINMKDGIGRDKRKRKLLECVKKREPAGWYTCWYTIKQNCLIGSVLQEDIEDKNKLLTIPRRDRRTENGCWNKPK